MISHEGDHLVFLLSMPRSGSTLLSLMLGSHPEICCPPEPWIVLALAEYLRLGDVRSTPYGREWAEIAAIEFLLKPERMQRGALGKALRMIAETSCLDAITAARQILQTAYQLHLDVSGRSIFVDKTPRYYAVLGLVDKISPRAKKIVLLRNPLDVFASYKTTWEIPRTIFTPEGVSVHARDFCEGLFTLADYIATPRNDLLVLRYEDLANDPESALRSACEFADIDFSPTMLAYYKNTALIEEYKRSPVGDPVSSSHPKPTSNRTVNAWEKRLDGVNIQALINVLGVKIFERLGYGDTVARLRDMSVDIPTEEQAFRCRNLLMRSLVDRVQEQPFSVWNNFVSPLKECQADRAARLEAIHRQQEELAGLQQRLRDSEADRAARLEVIYQQQEELGGIRQSLEVSEADRAARLDAIHRQQEELDRLRQSLEVSEADRAARLNAIHRQQEELDRLHSFYGFLCYRFSKLKRWIDESAKK
ncbi:Clusterin-associated protein-1 [Candidatus Nitrotoga sp. HW29]|uniref:sulfotransferase family protein n=1 Tax=Candidatus Nitrotoga sp. HW29 TaxID=2886963 RepID=UPI001EF354BE|nr:sulfotransferase [Candidatus Nitrotoga sp. HW29]CAH1904841.1 Clusterin-associated protein-1 [Candidatus Nitrotoga sp. HW29]